MGAVVLRDSAVEVSEGPTSVRIAVRGVVDQPVLGELRTALARQSARKPEHLLLDLSEVSDFDRYGLAVLVTARRWLGDRLSVACDGHVRDILQATGLDRVLTLA